MSVALAIGSAAPAELVPFSEGRLTLSFGSLYPCLKALVRNGYIVEQAGKFPIGRGSNDSTVLAPEIFAIEACPATPS